MVFLALKPSRLAASCWSLAVVKGGGGLRRRSLRSTEATVKRAFSISAARPRAVSPSVSSALCPSTLNRRARNSGGSAAARSASSVQYSTLTKASISRSRSTTRRTATDCTRPAERPRRTFFQRMGLIW